MVLLLNIYMQILNFGLTNIKMLKRLISLIYL